MPLPEKCTKRVLVAPRSEKSVALNTSHLNTVGNQAAAKTEGIGLDIEAVLLVDVDIKREAERNRSSIGPATSNHFCVAIINQRECSHGKEVG